MNILLLTREYKHPNLPTCGGTGSFMASLAKELVKQNHVVHVIGVNKVNAILEDEGVQIHYHKNLFRRNFVANFLRSFTKKIPFLQTWHCKLHAYEKKDIAKIAYGFIKKENITFDIIETHDFEGISLYLDNSVPYVVRCHGSFSLLEKYFNYKGVELGKKYCEQLAFKKAKNIISVSEFSELANRELFGINHFKRIYNGIDTAVFKRDESTKVIPKSIFYFGTVAFEKGADTAVQILIQMVKKEPQTTLHFLGIENKNHASELVQMIEKNGLQQHVHFYGFQKTQELIKLLSQAEVVIFPSKGETFGLALCEAMSLSKPVIVSDIPAFKEIIVSGENGYIASSIDDYCENIELLFNDQTKSGTLKKNARNTIVERFSQEKMLRETLAYYQEVIGTS